MSRASLLLLVLLLPSCAQKEPLDVGLVLIPSGDFLMGSAEGLADELPQVAVHVDGFRMSATEITNRMFRQFVRATGYMTTAEKTPDKAVLMAQLPEGAQEPDPTALVPGALVHHAGVGWEWVIGAQWCRPLGPDSNIDGKEDFPVVQVSWDDAVAFCNWVGGRLPTEAEWEWAARGGLSAARYPWGDEEVLSPKPHANVWQGEFPVTDSGSDGFKGCAPVRSFAANGYGLHDMAGNVWEWCSDWYRGNSYALLSQSGVRVSNPTGPEDFNDPAEPTIPKRVMRGGSFLCDVDVCHGYRCSARMKSSCDTGLNHLGFRVVLPLQK
ncbi:MAG: formylglycine-generating enzyme family protein [Planctomycetes bacterium]|nr:formylglycine-generating enzyme family protein [Planctomycetota bacterium]